MDAILFRKCLGLNDTRAVSSQRMITEPRDPEAGNVEFIDCLNVTTTPDGCVEKIPPLVTALTHTAPIINISAGKRLLFTDGVDTSEWSGTAVTKRFPLVSGPMVHTPIDCRVSTATQVFKSPHAAPTMAEAVVGTNPGPVTSTSFSKMPAFDSAFVYNSRLCSVNHADPRFLQYSRPFAYDLWNLGDDFVPHMLLVLQAVQIPGCVVALHAGGVSVYTGGDLSDVARKFYPCPAINGTLYSGFISEADGHAHVFLGSDGVYVVDASGKLSNITPTFRKVSGLNTSYTCATAVGGKYLAFGSSICVEYDFETKTVLKRSSQAVKGAAVWNGTNYFATGSTVSSYGSTIDTSSITTSITLPFSDLGAVGTKSLSCFYFTGEIGECATFTVTDSKGDSWSVQEDGIGAVTEYRIKAPRGDLGNRVSVKVESTSGTFRMEELRAVFMSGKRTR